MNFFSSYIFSISNSQQEVEKRRRGWNSRAWCSRVMMWGVRLGVGVVVFDGGCPSSPHFPTFCLSISVSCLREGGCLHKPLLLAHIQSQTFKFLIKTYLIFTYLTFNCGSTHTGLTIIATRGKSSQRRTYKKGTHPPKKIGENTRKQSSAHIHAGISARRRKGAERH